MRLAAYQAVFCDLDGCLVSGERVLPGAEALVAEIGARLWIVSNNSTETATGLSARLLRLGLAIPADRIVLAGEQAVRLLARREPGARLALYAPEPLIGLARDMGLAIDDEAPTICVLGRDLDFSYAKLSRIVRQLARGARLVVANLDDSHPGADGLPVPETGSLLAAIRSCLPELSFEAIGKPSATLFRHALADAGLAPEDVLFIGDNPETDGRGAAAAQIPFRLVAPGQLPEVMAE